MLRLPLVTELGDGTHLAVRNEHRIEAEAFAAARLCGNPAAEHSGTAHFLAAGAERDELRDIPRAAGVAVGAVERAQHPPDFVARRATRRMHTGPAVEPHNLDARVLGDHPLVVGRARPPEARLCERVLVVRRAVLRRIVVGVDDADLPARQQALELLRLVRVPRREPGLHSQRTSATFGTSAMSATRRGAARSRSSARSSSKRRRSPSWLTSIAVMRAPARSISSI